LIDATPVLLEFHETARPVSTLPPASLVTTVNAGADAPSTTDCDVGEIVTLATGTALTVSVAALLVLPSLVAVIDVVPGDWPVATPVVVLIDATLGLLDANVTVRPVSTLPLPSFVTAVNAGVLDPSTTDCVAGESVTLATGTAVTVSVAAELVLPSLEAVIDAVPGDWPVATPVVVLIVATPVLLDANVTARPGSTLPPASLVTAVKAGVDEPSTTV
jgi:hypothetical protein